jgi:hypothetical protein
MARSNAAGFLAGFLGAANEDSKRRQTNADKRTAMNQVLMAKRKEVTWMNEVKNHEEIKKLHRDVNATGDPVARQSILAKFHGVPDAVAQSRPLDFQLPEIPENPMGRLDSLEKQHSVSGSPIVRKLREGAQNLKVALGFKDEEVTPAPAPTVPQVPGAPVAPVAPVAPTTTAAPTQEELSATFPPKTELKIVGSQIVDLTSATARDIKGLKVTDKKNVQLIEQGGKFFAVDKNNVGAGAVEVEGIPDKVDGFNWQLIETETVDPETQETTVELQAARIDEKSGETILGSNAITKKVKALRDKTREPQAQKVATKAERSRAKGVIVGLDMTSAIPGVGISTDEENQLSAFQAQEFIDVVEEFKGQGVSVNELEAMAVGRTLSKFAPLDAVVTDEMLPRLGRLKDSQGNRNAEAEANFRALIERIRENPEENSKLAEMVKIHIQQFR